jgi:hypothetical protein
VREAGRDVGFAAAENADSTGDWKKRSNPGGLRRIIISPKVTTV